MNDMREKGGVSFMTTKSFLHPGAYGAAELLDKGIQTAKYILSHDAFVINAAPVSIPYFVDNTPGQKCPLCHEPIEPRDAYNDSTSGAWGHKACVIESRQSFTVLRTNDTEKRLTEREEQ